MLGPSQRAKPWPNAYPQEPVRPRWFRYNTCATYSEERVEINRLFGLPAHPLLVHIPVVLLPLTAIGAVAVAVSSTWRRRLGWILVVLSGISLVFVQLAIGSGESLQEGVEGTGSERLIHEHSQIAEQLRPFAFLFFVALTAYVGYTWWREREAITSSDSAAASPAGTATMTRTVARQPIVITLAVLTVVSGAAATVWTVRAGHSGAKATWHRVQPTAGEGGESAPDPGGH